MTIKLFKFFSPKARINQLSLFYNNSKSSSIALNKKVTQLRPPTQSQLLHLIISLSIPLGCFEYGKESARHYPNSGGTWHFLLLSLGKMGFTPQKYPTVHSLLLTNHLIRHLGNVNDCDFLLQVFYVFLGRSR
jgi:hypothetical protein